MDLEEKELLNFLTNKIYSLWLQSKTNVLSILRISAIINSVLLTLGIAVLSIFQAIHFVWFKAWGSKYIVSSSVESNIAQMFALLLLSILAGYWIKNSSTHKRHFAWSIYLVLSIWQTLAGVNLTTGIAMFIIALWSFRYVWGESISAIALTTIKNIETAMMDKLDSVAATEEKENNKNKDDSENLVVDDTSEEEKQL
jgi:uncharacterized membrane protein